MNSTPTSSPSPDTPHVALHEAGQASAADALIDRVRATCTDAAQGHRRLCPRQVLGVRMGFAGAAALGLDVPRDDKRLFIFAETDGCFVDGISAATGCTVGHRTMRLIDYGRVAITAVDSASGTAVRLSPRADVRERAMQYAPGEHRRYYAQLEAYQRMPDDVLLDVRPVALALDLAALISERGVRVDCARCGEEVLNRREVASPAGPLCPGCAGPAYYRPA